MALFSSDAEEGLLEFELCNDVANTELLEFEFVDELDMTLNEEYVAEVALFDVSRVVVDSKDTSEADKTVDELSRRGKDTFVLSCIIDGKLEGTTVVVVMLLVRTLVSVSSEDDIRDTTERSVIACKSVGIDELRELERTVLGILV